MGGSRRIGAIDDSSRQPSERDLAGVELVSGSGRGSWREEASFWFQAALLRVAYPLAADGAGLAGLAITRAKVSDRSSSRRRLARRGTFLHGSTMWSRCFDGEAWSVEKNWGVAHGAR